MKIVIFFLISG